MAEYAMKTDVAQQRQFPRYDHCCTIQYKLSDQLAPEVFSGVTRNISCGGICLYISHPHEEGQKINIISSLPVGSDTAELRWIETENALYVTGWVFVDEKTN